MNEGDSEKVAGVIFTLEIQYNDNSKNTLVSDASWLALVDETKDATVKELAPWVKEPWAHSVYFEKDRHIGQPIFRKNFTLEQLPNRAVVHVSGIGQFVLMLNGAKVGGDFLDPPWSVYERTSYYRSFDITALLKEGTNEWRLIMGKGFNSSIGDRITHHTHRWGQIMAILYWMKKVKTRGILLERQLGCKAEELYQRFQSSGLTRAAFARSNGINRSTFSNWARRYEKKADSGRTRLLEVNTVGSVSAPIGFDGMELRFGSRTQLHLSSATDSKWLATLLINLEGSR